MICGKRVIWARWLVTTPRTIQHYMRWLSEKYTVFRGWLVV
jgi:hypothetical protein